MGFTASRCSSHRLVRLRAIPASEVRGIGDWRHLLKPAQVDQAVPLPNPGNFLVSAPGPLLRMNHNAGADHVQIDVVHAVPEVTAILNYGRVIALAPERAPAMLAAVVICGKLPLEVAHESADVYRSGDDDKLVGVI